MGILAMEPAANDDTHLVQETLAGSQVSFQLLVERYEGRLFALARHYTRNQVDVEDIVQDSFLKAYRRLESFDHRSSFYTWLYRIAVNTILDSLKRKGRSPVAVVEDPEMLAQPAPVEGCAPSVGMERDEIVQVTHKILEQIPDIFRTVLVLRELEGLAYQEIADTLGISIGTVESRLFRARGRFKEKLLALYPEFGEH
jgi:RNA polymerase sigma-70 factor (ECF subfamily)